MSYTLAALGRFAPALTSLVLSFGGQLGTYLLADGLELQASDGLPGWVLLAGLASAAVSGEAIAVQRLRQDRKSAEQPR